MGRLKSAFTFVEVMVAAAIITLLSGATVSALLRLQRNAADNRNDASAQIVLRNMLDQAMTRGWDDEANPGGILAPTVSGSSSDFDVSAGGWQQWDYFRAADTADPAAVVTIYSDQIDPARDVSGRVYRKVQRVKDNPHLLWITARIIYTYGSRTYSREFGGVRSLD